MRKTKHAIAGFASLLCVLAMALSVIGFAPDAAWAADGAPAVTYTVKIDGKVYATDYVSGRQIDVTKDAKLAKILKQHNLSANKVQKVVGVGNVRFLKTSANGTKLALSGAGSSKMNVECSLIGPATSFVLDGIKVEATQNPYSAVAPALTAQADDVWTITYKAGDGTGEDTTQEVTKGDAATLDSCTFTYEGHSFDKWVDADGNEYADGQADVEVTGDMTLTAQWKEDLVVEKVKVTFNANGGTNTMNDQEVEKGVEAELNPNAFARDGYVFNGWNTAADGSGDGYEDKGKVTLDSDLALYAQWKKDKRTVTFDANGGTGTMAPQDILKNLQDLYQDHLSANTFTRTGYSFIRWNTKKDGSGVNAGDKALVKLLSDTTLYAQWGHHVSFDANGGTGDMTKLGVVSNSEAKLTTNSFTRDGYKFVGWNTAADGSGTAYADKDQITISKDTTLYAQWEKKAEPKPDPDPEPEPTKFTVNFDSNGGEGSMAPQVFTKGSNATLSANTFTREGYTFSGWKSDDGKSYRDKQSTSFDHDATLYAQWQRNQVTVRFIANGGSGKMDSITLDEGAETTLPACTFARSGYTFKGWSTAANGQGTTVADKATVRVSKNINLYAQWEKNSTTARTSSTSSNTDALKQGDLAKTNDPTNFGVMAAVAAVGAALVGAGIFYSKKKRG